MTGSVLEVGGFWLIGDLAADSGYVATPSSSQILLPNKIREWQYGAGLNGFGTLVWNDDHLLTVTGNIIILRSLY